MKEMKRIIALLASISIGAPALAQNSSATWKQILKKCDPTQEIGKQILFFGVSNSIGPGSVWRFANDKSIRLVSTLSDAVPSASDQAKIIAPGKINVCATNQSTKWNLKLRLPFSTGATPLTLDIAAALGKADDVQVSIEGYGIDVIDEFQWKSLIPLNSSFVQELNQPGPQLLVAENSYKVTGLKATFSYKTDLSADVKAKFKGKSFMLGNSSTGTGTKLGNSKTVTGGSSKNSTPSNKSSSAGSSDQAGNCSTRDKSNSRPSNGKTAESVDTGQTENSANTPTSSSASSSGKSTTGSGSSDDSLATLHTDLNGNNQIIVCVEGPSYMLAAYSRLKGTTPVGINQPKSSAAILIMPFNLPDNAAVKGDGEQ